MKLSEYEGEEALDLLADLIEPASEIFGDPEVVKAVRGGETKAKIVKLLIKNHKDSILEILAMIDGVPVSEYKCNVLTLPVKILEIVNDKELMGLFQSQGQITGVTLFGSATENTGEQEK